MVSEYEWLRGVAVVTGNIEALSKGLLFPDDLYMIAGYNDFEPPVFDVKPYAEVDQKRVGYWFNEIVKDIGNRYGPLEF